MAAECPYCLDEACDGVCDHDQRIEACGPCAQCGDPCEPGTSLCHACAKAELEETAHG
jgi:hypothetical protein